MKEVIDRIEILYSVLPENIKNNLIADLNRLKERMDSGTHIIHFVPERLSVWADADGWFFNGSENFLSVCSKNVLDEGPIGAMVVGLQFRLGEEIPDLCWSLHKSGKMVKLKSLPKKDRKQIESFEKRYKDETRRFLDELAVILDAYVKRD
ncbi:MAG: hypothetical protein LBS06_03230 [Treponema sp.]|jgi:hypothetical protein|nr:hypothetical protein [Treponema sp.]